MVVRKVWDKYLPLVLGNVLPSRLNGLLLGLGFLLEASDVLLKMCQLDGKILGELGRAVEILCSFV